MKSKSFSPFRCFLIFGGEAAGSGAPSLWTGFIINGALSSPGFWPFCLTCSMVDGSQVARPTTLALLKTKGNCEWS